MKKVSAHSGNQSYERLVKEYYSGKCLPPIKAWENVKENVKKT
jgi:hypothetical protein